MKLAPIARRLLRENAVDLPEYIYHVSPYTPEIKQSGKLIPGGMGAGADFGRGFGGGVTHGISFFSDLNTSKDYANGILLAILLANVRNKDGAIETFDDWAKMQEDRLGVNLDTIRDYFKRELDRYYKDGEDIAVALKSVRQVVTIAASRISPRLDDPVIYGPLTKFRGVDINDIGIVVVKTSNIPSDAEVKQGTDPGEIRISGAEVPIYKTMNIL